MISKEEFKKYLVRKERCRKFYESSKYCKRLKSNYMARHVIGRRKSWLDDLD